jgi:hypothetical protein
MVCLKSIQRRFALARSLSLSDWLIVAEAWIALIGFHLTFEQRKFHLPVKEEPVSKDDRAIADALRLHRLLIIASRLHWIKMTCLIQSLALQWMLKRRGMDSCLRIGANMTGRQMFAHAWIEIGDQPIGEAPDIAERFKVLRSI